MKCNPETAASSSSEGLVFPENANTCISCGAIIPEGLLVCPTCEKDTGSSANKCRDLCAASLTRMQKGVERLRHGENDR